jgi:hypothetical protein
MAINESEDDDDKSYSEPFRGTNVIVKLSDCMECYIRISRCQVKNRNNRKENRRFPRFFFFFSSTHLLLD